MTLSADTSRVHRDTQGKPRPSAAPRLLVELRRRAADTSDGAVSVTHDELATALGVSRRTIIRAAWDLLGTELITVSGPEIWNAPNTYRVL